MSSGRKIHIKISEIAEQNPVKIDGTNKQKKRYKQDDIYHLINTEHKKKKLPLFTKVVITFELSFLIITFILAFRRAMIILLQNNKQEIEEVQITPKKKQIFKSNTDLLKICICTFAKNQNLYINEFVEFYQKIGINKIFLYDNNDENGEKFDDILKLYINNGTVEIINWRGKNAEHEEMMSDCYKNNYINYDWLIFYEIDEYIHIKENNDLKLFLSDQKFDNCECIYLNWLFHTDNNLIYYDNRTLQERFPIPEPNPQKNNSNVKHLVKTIMKGHGKIIEINNIYKLSDNLNGCDGNGNPPIFNGNEMVENDFENNYIIHYSCKSTEEFLKKLNNESIDDSAKNQSIYEYFLYNEINEEKINYIENQTKLNLTEFRLILNEEQIKK
jgi:hypothetical protein